MYRNECKKRKAKQHEKEKEYMKSLKHVKETGEYKTQRKEESSTDEEGEKNASDDGLDQVNDKVQASSSDDETSDVDDSVPGTPLSIVYDCESTAADIYRDHVIEIAAEVVLPEHIPSSFLTTELSFQSLASTSRRILPAGMIDVALYVGPKLF